MSSPLNRSEYSESRARRARHEDDRVRFLAVAQSHRPKVTEGRGRTTKAVGPKGPSEQKEPAPIWTAPKKLDDTPGVGRAAT